MQDRVSYEFAIIRIVPRVEREEFFNVGVILYSKRKRFLDVKIHIDAQKLQALGCDVEQEVLQSYLDVWQDVCKGSPKGGAIGEMEQADRFRWLAAPRSTIIQSSATHPGMCHEPQVELDELFENYVL